MSVIASLKWAMDDGTVLNVSPHAAAEASIALTCHRCGVRYNTRDNVPVELVPCGHTVCASCVGVLAVRDADGVSRVRCPAMVRLGEESVRCNEHAERFAPNETVMEFLSPIEKEIMGLHHASATTLHKSEGSLDDRYVLRLLGVREIAVRNE